MAQAQTPRPPVLTAEQEAAFAAWLAVESAQIYWPDANNAREIALAAFTAGVYAVENADSIRYEVQYARRFGLGGARHVERNLRESRGARGTT